MQYIELHDERDTAWVKVDDIGMIETTKIRAIQAKRITVKKVIAIVNPLRIRLCE